LKKFPEYKELDLTRIANSVSEYWEGNKTFEKSISIRKGNPKFVFFEGPPSANGMPGIHHVMARTIKDIFCRYKTQKGFIVERKAGWDTHGLPVELGVEKQLGITKEDIGKSVSVKDYNKACREAVMKYTDVWNLLTKRIGYWVDMQNPYVTFTTKYIESVWWLIKKINDKSLLYKGYTIQPYSPMAGTGLSSHELNQPGTYKDVSDTSITAQFKVIPESLPKKIKNNFSIYILAWTTTPWTLPSNTALTVGLKIKYVIINTYNQYTFKSIKVIIARELVDKQFDKKYFEVDTLENLLDYNSNDKIIPYLIESEVLGKDLVGIRYEQIWSYSPLPLDNPENAFRVISGDFVTTEEGTGVVHTAPTFGADDAKVAKQAVPEVPPLLVMDQNNNKVPLVNLKGKFTENLGFISGKFVKNEYYPEGEAPEKSIDVEIAIALKELNRAFKVEKYTHSYPNCWRTDKPILYYPLDSWFIKITDVRNRMCDLNKTINWKPKSTGTSRFGNWLENANDWNLSRSRFWGIPLPIWRTKNGDKKKVIGSISELVSEIKISINQGLMTDNPLADFVLNDLSEKNYNVIDLHKDTVDKIVLSTNEGLPMYRESDLIDVWFDSGAMPYAQWHYPFENKEKIEKNESFPADYIAEGIDQTRGWFYTLHAISTIVFDSISYKNVISNGLVLDKKGQKMSKRLGNAPDPFEILDKYGPDATRWYMISNANPWDNLKFDSQNIAEVQRKFFGTLYNTFSFFSIYANIDEFKCQEKNVQLKDLSELDLWIVSELNSLILKVDTAYSEYEPTRAARLISDFVQEKLSNWYVRLSRRRFWKGEYGVDKIAAYQTLYECLKTVSIIAAPIAPFYMDQLYQDLTSVTKNISSVHLELFPESNSKLINIYLEEKINRARNLTSLALSIRKKERIKVRQPLKKLIIPVNSVSEKKMIISIQDQLISEINVKEIEIIDDSSGLFIKKIKPNFKTLGPKYGKNLNEITNVIKKLSQQQILLIEEKKILQVKINGKNIILELSDLEVFFKDVEGLQVAQNNGNIVALDISLNQELINEGIARELVNRIQNIRKESGLKITDKIEIIIENNLKLKESLIANEKYIMAETLSKSLIFSENVLNGSKIEFDDFKILISVKKYRNEKI
jgi:isoleucyl-tRNA synthetase